MAIQTRGRSGIVGSIGSNLTTRTSVTKSPLPQRRPSDVGRVGVQTTIRRPRAGAKAKERIGATSTVPQRWLLALDPFSEVNTQPIWGLIQTLGTGSRSKVEATYVLAPSSLNWTGEFNGNWIKKYKPLAIEKMNETIPSNEVKKSVITCKDSGLRSAVGALITHARKTKATCLVVATHARSGLERMALGSFAETLILSSPIPVLVLNPGHVVPPSVRKILMPIDISRQSKRYVRDVVNYAKALGSEIILFHKQSDPLDPIVQQGVYSLGGGWMSLQKYIDAETEDSTQRLEKLEATIRRQGVMCSHVIDTSPDGLIESIDRVALENGVDLVTVLTRSGPWSAVLLGSVARALVRNSSVPVLVQRGRS